MTSLTIRTVGLMNNFWFQSNNYFRYDTLDRPPDCTASTYVANLTQTGKIGSGKNTKSLHIYPTGLKVHLEDMF